MARHPTRIRETPGSSLRQPDPVPEWGRTNLICEPTPEGGDFSLRYYFTPAADPEEYGYTYFEVVFGCHEPPRQPFHPFRFTVGFH